MDSNPPAEISKDRSALPERSQRHTVLAHLSAFAVFLALAGLLTWPLPLRINDGLISLGKDGLPYHDVAIFLWDFWWFHEAVFELGQSPFYCDMLAQPGPPVFVFPTLFPTNCALALPFMSFFSLETSYNLLVLLVLTLNGWAVYLLVRGMTGAWFPAVLAGVLFSSLPLLNAHIAQLNILSFYWFPLALVAGRRLLATGRIRWAALFGLCFLLMVLASWYHAISLGLFLLPAAGIAVWKLRSEAARRTDRFLCPLLLVWILVCAVWWQFSPAGHYSLWIGLLVYLLIHLHLSKDSPEMRRRALRLGFGALAIAIFALPVAFPMWLASKDQAWLRETTFAEKTVFSADLASWIMPPEMVERVLPDGSNKDDDLYGTRVRLDANMFPGFVGWLALIAALGWRLWRGRRGLDWLLLAFVFLILSLGPFLKFGGVVKWGIGRASATFLPGFIFGYLPVLEGLRVSSRFALPAHFCMAVFVGLQAADFLASIERDWLRRIAKLVCILIVHLLVAERIDLPRPLGSVPPTPAFDWLRKQPPGRVLHAPLRGRGTSRPGAYRNLFLQTRHEHAMVNPYVTRRRQDLDRLIEENDFLGFVNNPSLPGPAVLAKVRPDYMTRKYEELGARWIVLDRVAFAGYPIERITEFLAGHLNLVVAYEDEHFVVYEKKDEGAGASG